MKSFKQIAKVMQEAYNQELATQFNVPDEYFADKSDIDIDCWIAAAKAAYKEILEVL